MNVNDKIKQILIDKSLSPSVFADEIGVQRSSISHILSGRNRPSFDIIQKVIRRFPDLGYDWIMEEEGPEERSYPTKRTGVGLRSETKTPVPIQQPESVSGYTQRTRPANAVPSVQVVPTSASSSSSPVSLPVLIPTTTPEKAVERILIFYTDGTFKEYIPAIPSALVS